MLTAGAALPAQAPSAGCPRGALPAYAHNDYLNPRPLEDALSLGYQGVEADVFLVGGTLRLGHERKKAAHGRALDSTYLEPLRSIVERCGTLTADGRPFLLDIELKEASRAAYDTLVAVLTRYRELFAARDAAASPAVEVVLVGWDEPARLGDGPVPLWRQVQLRRPDGRAAGASDPTVRLISLDYHDTMGRWWTTGADRRRWLASVRAVSAAYPTVRMRAFHVPVDARVYRELFAAGVDLIGTQDVVGTARVLADEAR